MQSRQTLSLIAVVLLIAAACGSDGESAGPPPTTSPPGDGCVAPEGEALDIPYATEEGVDADLLSLDIFPAAGVDCGSAPVLVYVHGGGWRKSDKAKAPGLDSKRALAEANGWVLVSVNHRLSDPDAEEPVQYPAHPTDVARAVAFIQDDISGYGGDPNRLVLVGHSSGGGIASLLGTEPGFVSDAGGTPPACVISIDTEAYDVTEAIATGGETLVSQYELAFGTDPAVWVEASPIQQLDDSEPLPSFLVVTRGSANRMAISESFVSAVGDAGGSAQLIDASVYEQDELDEQVGADGEAVVTPAVVDFVETCTA